VQDFDPHDEEARAQELNERAAENDPPEDSDLFRDCPVRHNDLVRVVSGPHRGDLFRATTVSLDMRTNRYQIWGRGIGPIDEKHLLVVRKN
jgi:hypothetical protein